MQIKQSDVKKGDVLIMAKGGGLTIIKALSITKAGSLKYTHKVPVYRVFKTLNAAPFNLQCLDQDTSKHNKTSYLPVNGGTGYYENYFWLLKREDG